MNSKGNIVKAYNIFIKELIEDFDYRLFLNNSLIKAPRELDKPITFGVPEINSKETRRLNNLVFKKYNIK